MPTPNLTSPQKLRVDPIAFPIPVDATAKVLRESWWVNTANYSRTALGTAHPDSGTYPDFKLVDEQPFRATEYHTFFERVYATVPAARSEPIDIAYTFPGIADDGFGFGVSRAPLNLTVLGRIAFYYEYNTTPFDASTGITIIDEQRYLEASSGYDIGYVINAGWGTYGSTPSKATYLGWVSAGTEIVARASILNRYMGDIWERQTIYVVAK